MILSKYKKNNNAESVHYFDGKKTVYSKFNKVYISEKNSIIEIKIPFKFWEKFLGNFRLLRRLLRIDQYTIKVINPLENNLLIINSGTVYHYDGASKRLTKTLFLKQCNQLLKNSICVTPENEIFFGEYGQNNNRNPVPIYKSVDGGKNWKMIYEIAASKARHIHGCFWDNFEKKIWILTGDFEYENHFIKTDTNFKNLEWIGDGSQTFRACNLFFKEKYIYWITDSELEKNFLYKMHRKTKKLTKLQDFPGPVWYTKAINKNCYLASITCEKGKGSHKKYGFIFYSDNLESWKEVYRLKKDLWPKKYFKNGVISFSDGEQKMESFEMSGEGFIGFDGCSYLCNIKSINIFIQDYIKENILDINSEYSMLSKKNSTPKKFNDIAINDIIILINRSNQSLNQDETILNELILRYCEINYKSLYNKKNIFSEKNGVELLLTLFVKNYINKKDLRYLNILLKLTERLKVDQYLKQENKKHFIHITNILLENYAR